MPREQGLTWDELERLIDENGDVSDFPDRLRQWRSERGWSVQNLADQLKGTKVPLSRASLIRLESGDRKVTIAEAIELTRFFGKRIKDLLLPDDALGEVNDWRLFADATSKLAQIELLWAEYIALIERLRERLPESPKLRGWVERERLGAGEKLESVARQNFDAIKRTDQIHEAKGRTDRLSGLPPTFEQFFDSAEPTPIALASEHVLRADPLTPQGWRHGWKRNANYEASEAKTRAAEVRRARKKKGTK